MNNEIKQETTIQNDNVVENQVVETKVENQSTNNYPNYDDSFKSINDKLDLLTKENKALKDEIMNMKKNNFLNIQENDNDSKIDLSIFKEIF